MVPSLFNRTPRSDSAADMIRDLRTRHEVFAEPLEYWGPLDDSQYDTSGLALLQTYRTLLVRLPSERWYFVRMVIETHGREKTPGPEYVSQITPDEARGWLQDHLYCRRRTMSAARSRAGA